MNAFACQETELDVQRVIARSVYYNVCGFPFERLLPVVIKIEIEVNRRLVTVKQ